MSKYAGWVFAICSVNGPATLAYLGKVETRHADGAITLVEAIEVRTALTANAAGELGMVRNGLPIGFFGGASSVNVRPFAEVPLDGAAEIDVQALDSLIAEAKRFRDGLYPSSGAIVPAAPSQIAHLAAQARAQQNGNGARRA